MDLLASILSFRLGAAYRRIDRMVNRSLREFDLTHADLHILFCVLHHGELRVTDIAQATGFEESTTSRLVRELARRKLLRRRKHPDDARSHLISPATRARTLRIQLEQVLLASQSRIARDLPDADRDGFLRTTDLIDKSF